MIMIMTSQLTFKSKIIRHRRPILQSHSLDLLRQIVASVNVATQKLKRVRSTYNWYAAATRLFRVREHVQDRRHVFACSVEFEEGVLTRIYRHLSRQHHAIRYDMISSI